MSDDNRLAADEYEKQYYGFSSTEIIEDFKEHVTGVIKRALIDVKNAISEETNTPYDKESLDTIIQELYEAYLNSARNPIESFEAEARNIFAIPKNVILEEDKLRRTNYSDEDINKLKCEVAKLENDLIQEKVYLAKCMQVKEYIEKTIKPIYEKVNMHLSVAKRMPKQTDESEEANQQKIIQVHEAHVQGYFNRIRISGEQSRSRALTDFKTSNFYFD
ncbi:unnamed protein product [Phaedon cochleariae]|uniref:Uncharacterized protein n=1 Tax=Phaedon cochleariae TaxID=80249 RepID=A0A9P0DQA4_PHACE|nr:unnamed protein product [Phaedon cochleariae]